MARKPHNYSHFQNLVNELKNQNKENIATIEKQMEVQSALLYSMRGLLLKGVETEKTKVRKDKEDRLEGAKEKRKDLTMKSKMNLPRFSGKGFMGMLGNFLSTALMGIPGGLRRFMPASLGMALLPKLARGIALLVAGPSLVKALQAGFDQDTFSGGVTAFINSFFSPSGGAYQSLAEAAAGGAGKGALLGFGLLGPRGAIIGGVLGGALTGLNHIFAEDKSKVDSKGVMNAVKEHLHKNLVMWVGGAGAFLGAKTFMALGPAGMIAGAILGAGIGILGAGTIKEMMQIEKATGADWKTAMTQGLVNWFSSDQMKGILDFAPGGGALFGAMVLGRFGPAGMMAGLILGAGAGLLAGPVLAEALRIDKEEGKGMAKAYRKALVNYFKESPYAKKMVTGGVLGGIAGGFLTAGSIPGILGGMIIGAALGYATQFIIDELDEFFGISKRKGEVAKQLKQEVDKYGHAVSGKTVAHQTTEIADTVTENLPLGATPSSWMASRLLGIIANWENISRVMFPGKNAPPINNSELPFNTLNNPIMLRALRNANVDVEQLARLQKEDYDRRYNEWEMNRQRTNPNSQGTVVNSDASTTNYHINNGTNGTQEYSDLTGSGLFDPSN